MWMVIFRKLHSFSSLPSTLCNILYLYMFIKLNTYLLINYFTTLQKSYCVNEIFQCFSFKMCKISVSIVWYKTIVSGTFYTKSVKIISNIRKLNEYVLFTNNGYQHFFIIYPYSWLDVYNCAAAVHYQYTVKKNLLYRWDFPVCNISVLIVLHDIGLFYVLQKICSNY